jgi:4'-phosphopantetheinyl transferase EntD
VSVRVVVLDGRTITANPARLTAAERVALAQLRGSRRDEWIRGRLAVRRVLGDPDTSVLVRDDGAPLPTGGRPCSVSLSHDGSWIAVAIAPAGTGVGVDLCERAREPTVARILRWLDVRTSLDPLATWTALEAALKVRGLGIEALRDRALEVRVTAADGARVHGLGADLTVRSRIFRDFVLGCALEAA